jgi:hypothetical protein
MTMVHLKLSRSEPLKSCRSLMNTMMTTMTLGLTEMKLITISNSMMLNLQNRR